jgi:hypothetical protein
MAQLDQRLVTKYAKLNALKNLIERWLESKKAEIKEALKSGAKCPARGPYVLELQPCVERVDWRGRFKAHLAKEHGGDENFAEMYLTAIEQDTREASGQRLVSKVNPLWKQKFEPRLPRA